MAASRSTRVTRSTVGLNGLDENFCGRTLRNRSIAHPEDIPSHPLVRSRSPKKRPDPLQTPKGSNGGRIADLKQQSPPDICVSPRKRGLSISENDSTEKETVENCEGRQEDLGSPALKRVKRCLRSETLNSSEGESSINADQEPSERKSFVFDNDADSPETKRTRRCLLLDDCDEREIQKESACEEGLSDSAFVESKQITSYETVNGIDEEVVAALYCDNSLSDGNTNLKIAAGSCSPNGHTVAENGNLFARSSPLLSSRLDDPVSDHNVPCTNSQQQVELEDHTLTNDCPPCEHNQANESVAVPTTEVQSSVKYSEEEVVVGNSSDSNEQCSENSNLNNDRDSASISGELETTSSLDAVSPQITYFSEHQEHGYTLRASPSRVTPIKGSPPRSNSPCRENGEIEENVIPTDTKVAEIVRITQSPVNSVDVTEPEKEIYCDPGECADEELAKPSLEAANLVTGCVPPVVESGSLQSMEEEEEEPDVYYFESDHVALKHNKDYQRLLQTIAVLEAQRTQAVQDLENLGSHQHEALKDPIGFVERLQKKADIGLPYPQRVVQLPDISWDQYTTSLGNFEREFRNRKRHSRRVKLTFDKVGLPVRPKSPLESTKDGESHSYSVLPLSDGPEGLTSSHAQQLIRGRLCDESKPETFNQLWSIEEQKRLEQLLLKYPPEEVESRRWQKIADDLGNRTAKQVASRVQKYFIKLTKAGIPVPGRTPNLYLYSKKSASKRQHPLNKHLFRPSTFMTSHEPPVYMDEDSLSSLHSRDLDTAAEDDVSDEENIPLACRELAEYKELLELKKLKKQKLLQIHAESGFVNHVGFKCDNCRTEPIQGIRWHCQDCPQQMSVDFCDSCSDCLHETATHKEDHHLEPVYRVETFLDRDYCMSQGTSYNYLDPNYFPANR